MLGSVKVDTAKLLSTLKENKAKHVAEYDEAVANYRVKAEKELRKRAIEIRDEKTLQWTLEDLPVPRSFEKEYDRAIAMVEWSTDESIDLEETDFNAFVLDEWHWRGAFAGSTSHYNNAR